MRVTACEREGYSAQDKRLPRTGAVGHWGVHCRALAAVCASKFAAGLPAMAPGDWAPGAAALLAVRQTPATPQLNGSASARADARHRGQPGGPRCVAEVTKHQTQMGACPCALDALPAAVGRLRRPWQLALMRGDASFVWQSRRQQAVESAPARLRRAVGGEGCLEV